MSSAGHIFHMIKSIKANKLSKPRFGRFKDQKKWNLPETVESKNNLVIDQKDESYCLVVKDKIKNQRRKEMIKVCFVLGVLLVIYFGLYFYFKL